MAAAGAPPKLNLSGPSALLKGTLPPAPRAFSWSPSRAGRWLQKFEQAGCCFWPFIVVVAMVESRKGECRGSGCLSVGPDGWFLFDPASREAACPPPGAPPPPLMPPAYYLGGPTALRPGYSPGSKVYSGVGTPFAVGRPTAVRFGLAPAQGMFAKSGDVSCMHSSAERPTNSGGDVCGTFRMPGGGGKLHPPSSRVYVAVSNDSDGGAAVRVDATRGGSRLKFPPSHLLARKMFSFTWE